MKADENSAKVGFPPPLVYLGFLLLGFAADRLLALPGLGLSQNLRILLAAAAIGIGAALLVAAIGGFRRAGTPPQPWREVSAFVVNGVYHFTRNPMYLGMAAIHLGLALGFGSIGALAALVLAIIAIRTQVIAREEAYMAARFGADYAAYCRQVRRWL